MNALTPSIPRVTLLICCALSSIAPAQQAPVSFDAYWIGGSVGVGSNDFAAHFNIS